MTTFEILPNGNLKISLDYSENPIDFIKERIDDNISDDDIFIELIETHLCNGYTLVNPESIGALTDGFIISDTIFDEENTKEESENANLWFFNDYQTVSEVDKLLENGYIIYTKV